MDPAPRPTGRASTPTARPHAGWLRLDGRPRWTAYESRSSPTSIQNGLSVAAGSGFELLPVVPPLRGGGGFRKISEHIRDPGFLKESR